MNKTTISMKRHYLGRFKFFRILKSLKEMTIHQKIREQMYFELIVLVIVNGFSLYYLSGIWGMPWEASLLGSVLIGLITLFSLYRITCLVLDWRSVKQIENEQGQTVSTILNKYSLSIILFLITIAYLGSVKFVGYWPSTFIFLIISFRFLGIKKLKTLLVASISITVGSYLLFGLFLNVKFPESLLYSLISNGG